MKKKRHFKKSKFDPYINEISEYLAAGTPVSKIVEKLDNYFDDAVNADALYAFINSRGLKTKYSGGLGRYYEPPVCDKCENCHEVIGLNNKLVRMCYSTRLISWSVKTSPDWCHLRERQAG